MHVTRVNAGLNTVDQIPIVQNMINSHSALAQWAEVDLYQSYLFYIQQRILDPMTPGSFPRCSSWGNGTCRHSELVWVTRWD